MDFHTSHKKWTCIKHKLVKECLHAFVRTYRGTNKVFFVDAFAGPGNTLCGQEGSPVISAKLAELNKHLHCINFEKNEKTFEALEKKHSRLQKNKQQLGRFYKGNRGH
jgi:three-Cys-motif partner protein